MTKAHLHIGRLIGGGLVLGYRCPSRCRHCLYACGPHRDDGQFADAAALEQVLDLLAERAPAASFHIGGGEPFLFADRLEQAIAGLARRGLSLAYVETNAAWLRDAQLAAITLIKLRGIGLKSLLVSLSPFHAEFVPLERTLALIRTAHRALPGGAMVWIPEFERDLAQQPPAQTLDLDAFLASRGDDYARRLASRYGLIEAGRAGRYLARHGQRIPWQQAVGQASCLARLTDTTHFHVDGRGRYVPGLCAGIELPLQRLPGEVPLDGYPLLETIVNHGLGGLVRAAMAEGFEPLPAYASACDLCTHVRCFFYPRGFAELGPPGFYDARSGLDYTRSVD